VNLDIGRRLNANPDLISLNAQYGDHDVIPDDKFLSNSSCQNEHSNLPLVSDIRFRAFLLLQYAYAKTIARRLKSNITRPSCPVIAPFPFVPVQDFLSFVR
jgi:hypothetical protein